MNRRTLLAILAVTPLFLIMALSFTGVPWPTDLHAVPVVGNETSPGIADSLFSSFPITILLIAILLGSSMIGGIYLAKMDEAEVGP